MTLVSCWQERTGGRERTPPFPIAALTPGGRKACKLFELCSLSSDGGSGWSCAGQQRPVPKTEHSQDQETVDTGIPAGGFMCAAFIPFSVLKKLRVKWLVVLNLTLFPLLHFRGTF